MIKYQQRQSGLVVPQELPKPKPRPQYGPLELHEPERREAARKALLALWDAMNLSSPPGIVTVREQEYEAHWQAYRYIGKMLLGKDCPEKEVKT